MEKLDFEQVIEAGFNNSGKPNRHQVPALSGGRVRVGMGLERQKFLQSKNINRHLTCNLVQQ